MGDEEWVRAATVDDTVVAELLIVLKQVKQHQSPEPPPTKPALSVEWSVRQRRSKAVVVHQAKKQAQTASPTTPLSWSGGATSVSGAGGGSGSGSGSGTGTGTGTGSGCGGCSVDGAPDEESSPPPKCSGISRSKVVGASETATNKRSRKKKTLSELKHVEDMLQKERRQLKRELATLRLNLEKERATNENFKSRKLELQAVPAVESDQTVKSDSPNLDTLQQKVACVEPVPTLLPPIIASKGVSLQSPPERTCFEGNKELTVGKFVLPDLNIPVEENSSSDTLCGVS
ncbi:hypothetical protein ACH5RR_008258 [Cinchona calisaya]|uniref:Uncharacterized protein n=1 Tax=Cinchona calisaya TaxID=153742 RepID=A0ABD3AB04_9GENT